MLVSTALLVLLWLQGQTWLPRLPTHRHQVNFPGSSGDRCFSHTFPEFNSSKSIDWLYAESLCEGRSFKKKDNYTKLFCWVIQEQEEGDRPCSTHQRSEVPWMCHRKSELFHLRVSCCQLNDMRNALKSPSRFNVLKNTFNKSQLLSWNEMTNFHLCLLSYTFPGFFTDSKLRI